LINSSVCSRIYHDTGRKFRDCFLNEVGTQDIDGRARAAADRDIAVTGGGFTK
jgi:hypothetical protein